MKELSIEEKAKRYDDAIERAKIQHQYPWVKHSREVAEEIFPELKESEGEEIIKRLQNLVKGAYSKYGVRYRGIDTREEELLTWLEKQGEQKPNYCHHEVDLSECSEEYRKAYYDGWNNCNQQHAQLEAEHKPADKVEPKFKVGDWITNGEYTWKVTDIKPLDYILQSPNGDIVDDTILYVDEHFHLWTIQDAKDGDVLVSGQITILFKKFEEYSDFNFVIAYAGIDVRGELQITDGHWLISNDAKLATKEQRDQLEKAILKAGYKWNKNINKLEK